MNLTAPANVGRSELQQLTKAAFHGWYSFILGYPDHLVRDLLLAFGIEKGSTVLDPFCGTGTTTTECGKQGISSVGVDANPFAVFAAKTKSLFYIDDQALERASERAVERYDRIILSNTNFSSEVTFLYLNDSGMLERGWISPEPLRKALALREAIRRGRNLEHQSVLLLALAADLSQKIGNMRCGPSIYRGPAKVDVDPIPLFQSRVRDILRDLRAEKNRFDYIKPEITLDDARYLGSIGVEKRFDCLICSPPYPTEHDYTRHTRLELAFTEGVSTKACLQRIKRSMIRSHTKGIYKGDDESLHPEVSPSVTRLAEEVEAAVATKASGFEKLYPTVVRSYFGGMRRHFETAARHLKPGAHAAYVVGDQAAYMRVRVNTAQLLGEVAEHAGFKVRDIRLWRRRWSTGIKDYLDENILILQLPAG